MSDAAQIPAADPATAHLEAQVARVEAVLIDAEVAVETLRVELDNLARAHHDRLGPVYRRIDELDALIAEARAARSGSPDDLARAADARRVVDELPDLEALFERLDGAAEARSGGPGGGPGESAGRPHPEPGPAEPAAQAAPRRVRPSREAQRLYRELARHAHPDLVQEPEEKERRSRFIARVNEAYADGDEPALLRLADEWMSHPAAAPDPADPAQYSAHLLARLERMQGRINHLVRVHGELEASPMGELRRLSPDDPESLLLELAEQLLAEASRKERELTTLTGPADPAFG